MDQPGKVANPARGQRNSKNEHFPVAVRQGKETVRQGKETLASRIGGGQPNST